MANIIDFEVFVGLFSLLIIYASLRYAIRWMPEIEKRLR